MLTPRVVALEGIPDFCPSLSPEEIARREEILDRNSRILNALLTQARNSVAQAQSTHAPLSRGMTPPQHMAGTTPLESAVVAEGRWSCLVFYQSGKVLARSGEICKAARRVCLNSRLGKMLADLDSRCP